MILDGDLDAIINGARSNRLQHAHGIFDVGLDARRRTVGHAPQDATHDGRSDDLRGHDHAHELLFRAALLGIEQGGGGTDGTHADLEADSELFGVRADLAQVVWFEAAKEPDLGEMHDLNAKAGAVVQIFGRGPALGTDTEEIAADADWGD